MTITKHKILSGALMSTAVLAICALPAFAQSWPEKPVRLVVPFAAGGGVDNVARVVVQHLAPRLRQPIVVENKPGANANLGSDFVAKASPDGYTILMGATYLAFNRATMKNLPYDSAADFVPVARAARAPFVLVVPTTLPVKDVSELVAYMKANPDKAAYGTVGVGVPANLIFVQNTGTAPVQIVYKGGSAAMPDLITGRLTFMIQTASEVLPHIASGKLKALAVTGSDRFRALPDVPTMKQAGVSNLEGTGWWGMFVPAKTPEAIVQRLSTEMQAVLALPEVVSSFTKLGINAAPLPAADFNVFFRNEIKDYGDAARDFKITVE